MSLKSKRELSEVVRSGYLKARKIEKQKILDEFTSATGYHRKHAIRVLKKGVPRRKRRKRTGYQTVYRGEVVQVLEQIWEIYGHLCSKRLQPFLPEAIRVLERCQELHLSKDTKELLLKISSASIDRCLRSVRLKSPYDTAKIPYQRVLERQDISFEAKAPLVHLYVQLNPAELRHRIDQKIAQLWKIPR